MKMLLPEWTRRVGRGVFRRRGVRVECRRFLGRFAALVLMLESVACFAGELAAALSGPYSNSYARWKHGPSAAPGFFPLAVWLQNPAKAERYREAGINTYVGLWRGPTEDQLASLRKAGMKLICAQNETGRQHLEDPTIIGWMHGDEPDNAQSLGSGKGYGPPIPPARIVADYERLQRADPTRPVLLNLGQGVAWDNWIGRGVRRNHPEDYPEYVQGGDIISFDIYPVAHSSPDVAGKLEFVARGVERLGQWTGGRKVIWNCLECTRIQHPTRKATPHQVRAQAWMSIIHGSRGLIYFVHEWQPRFNESALLDDPEMLAAITALNRQITRLAPVLNSPSRPDLARITTDDPGVPVAALAKQHRGATYVFAVALRDGRATATITLPGHAGRQSVEVLDEGRTLSAQDGVFRDAFGPWAVHLYRLEQ